MTDFSSIFNQDYEKPASGIYLVPTPIGNLDDITVRALKILHSADFIACEDTRHSGQFLKLIGLSGKKLISYHEHNEKQKAPDIVSRIKKENLICALISDAGSPCVSDPGYRLVREAVENDLLVTALPGATAFVPALSASGMAVHNFIFAGFPPQKKGRQTFLRKITDKEETIILYESPYRIIKLLKQLSEICEPGRLICTAREISKIHEEYNRGTATELIGIFESRTAVKGEFVVIIEGKKDK